MNILRQVLVFCSGLKKPSGVKFDDSQRVALGLFVVLTAVFAAISGFYTLHFLSGSRLFSLPLALLWGFIILSVDRYVVTTLRKPVLPDKSKRISQIVTITVRVFPRLLLGILVAVVVAVPIELRLFKSAINQQILTTRQETIDQSFSQISELKKVNGNALYQLQEKNSEYRRHSDEADAELSGSGGTLVNGAGPVFERKRQLARRYQMEFEHLRWSIEPVIDKNTSTIDSLSAERSGLISQAKRDSETHDAGTVFQRIKALRELANVSPSIKWMTAAIMLLFILLESTPLLIKLLSKDNHDSHHFEINFGAGKGVALDVAPVHKWDSIQLGVLFLELLLPTSKRDHLIGDLLEEYEAIRENARNPFAALLWFYRQVATSIFPLLLKMLTDIPARRLRK